MMDLEEIPYLRVVFRFGARDRVLDAILLAGPIVIVAFTVLGRTLFITGLTRLYPLSFASYAIYKGIRR